VDKLKSQSGSAHLIIIIALSLALIGTLSFVYWNNFIQPKTTESNELSVDDSLNEAVDSTEYFSIDQWGIKGIYNGRYGIQYQLKTSTSSTEYIELSSSDVVEECTGRILNTISKYSAGDVIGGFGHMAIGEPNTAEYFYNSNQFGPNMRKVGDNYYLLDQGVTDVCSDDDTTQLIEAQTILDINRFFLVLQEQ